MTQTGLKLEILLSPCWDGRRVIPSSERFSPFQDAAVNMSQDFSSSNAESVCELRGQVLRGTDGEISK